MSELRSKVTKTKLTCAAACQGSRPERRRQTTCGTILLELQLNILIRLLLIVTASFILLRLFSFILLKIHIKHMYMYTYVACAAYLNLILNSNSPL